MHSEACKYKLVNCSLNWVEVLFWKVAPRLKNETLLKLLGIHLDDKLFLAMPSSGKLVKVQGMGVKKIYGKNQYLCRD